MRVCGLHDEHLRHPRHGNTVRAADFGHGYWQHAHRRFKRLDAEKLGLPILLCAVYCGGRARLDADSFFAAQCDFKNNLALIKLLSFATTELEII